MTKTAAITASEMMTSESTKCPPVGGTATASDGANGAARLVAFTESGCAFDANTGAGRELVTGDGEGVGVATDGAVGVPGTGVGGVVSGVRSPPRDDAAPFPSDETGLGGGGSFGGNGAMGARA